MTFEEAVDGDPRENGLCEYCDFESSGAVGIEICEQIACRDAYEAYLEDMIKEPCIICQHKASPAMSCSYECKVCDKYDHWKPKGGDYGDLHGLTCPQ